MESPLIIKIQKLILCLNFFYGFGKLNERK